jgi:hypothetical protein
MLVGNFVSISEPSSLGTSPKGEETELENPPGVG